MMEIPTWWLVVSGLFFVLNAILFAVLIFVALKLLGIVKSLQPQVSLLLTRVEAVAARVEEVAETVKITVANVGHKASNVAGQADSIVGIAGKQIGKYSPIVVGLLTALRLGKAVNDFRLSRQSLPHSTKEHAALAGSELKKAALEAVKEGKKAFDRSAKTVDKRLHRG